MRALRFLLALLLVFLVVAPKGKLSPDPKLKAKWDEVVAELKKKLSVEAKDTATNGEAAGEKEAMAWIKKNPNPVPVTLAENHEFITARSGIALLERKMSAQNPPAGAIGWGQQIDWAYWQGPDEAVSGITLKEPSAAALGNLRTAMGKVVSNTCIQFNERVYSDLALGSHSVLIMAQASGSASYGIGRRTSVTINGKKFHILSLGNAAVEGEIMHELGHLLGLGHTQQRNDFADFVKISPQNHFSATWYDQYGRPAGWDLWYGETGATPRRGADQGVFDFGSIMSYPMVSAAMASGNAVGSELMNFKDGLMKPTGTPDASWVDIAPRCKLAANGGMGQCNAVGAPQMATLSDWEQLNDLYTCPAMKYATRYQTKLHDTCKKPCPAATSYRTSKGQTGHCFSAGMGCIPDTTTCGGRLMDQAGICRWMCYLSADFAAEGCFIPGEKLAERTAIATALAA